MAAVRYTWMFRTAAVVFVMLGLAWLYTFCLTAYRPEQRPYGIAAAIVALLVGFFLFRRHRVAIGISAVAAAIVGISATVFAPTLHGPAILAVAGLALLCVTYAALSLRVLFEK
jgi:hypothetical protein